MAEEKKAFPAALDATAREAAWKKAVEVRAARAQLRKDVAAGKVSFGELVARRDDPIVGRMPVKQALTALPGIGDATARKLMEEASIRPSRRMKGLGPHQIESLVEALK